MQLRRSGAVFLKPGNALITGGARRIGRAIALALADAGWSVALHFNTSRREAKETAEECRRSGALRTATLSANLASEDARAVLVGRAAAALDGPLSLLINNASGFHRDDYAVPSESAARANFEMEVAAPLVLTQHFAAQAPAPLYEDDGEVLSNACIINLVDASALRPATGFASYLLAKSALIAMTRNAALEWAPTLRINAIAPGPTFCASRQSAEHFAESRRRLPLQRGPHAEEIAGTVLHILSCPSMTGQVIALDGGLHLGTREPRSRTEVLDALLDIEGDGDARENDPD